MKVHSIEVPFDKDTIAFYEDVLDSLIGADIPFMVGGAFAFGCYTGIIRMTKDLDLFLLPSDRDRALEILSSHGYRTEITEPIWLAKAIKDETTFVDLIYRSGNGICEVDEAWFENTREVKLLGRMLKLCPPEESIWQKAFVMERHRFDGADVAHYLHSCAEELDWRRLLNRFSSEWRVLFSYLLFFGFIYPDKRHLIPAWVQTELMNRLESEIGSKPTQNGVCRGTLMSRFSFIADVVAWGYRDARFKPRGTITNKEMKAWENERKAEDPGLMKERGISVHKEAS